MQTLTQLAKDIKDAIIDLSGSSSYPDLLEAVDTLAKAAIEQSGEAVAHVNRLVNCAIIDSTGCKTRWEYLPDGTPLYTRPQPAPAVPDGWRTMLQRLIYECERADKQALDEVRRGFIHGHVVAEARAILAAEPTAEESSVDQPAPAVPDGCRDVLFGNFDALEAAADAVEACGMNSHAEGVRAVRHALSMLAAAPQPAQQLPSALADIAAERRRQIEVEGWTPEHDDQYGEYVLPCAAGCYAMYTLAYPAGDPPRPWPWAGDWWKPSADPRRNLVKSGALIAAAIERIDRATVPQPKRGGV
ncbi:hypothetical protein [Chromobacterium vaccinii]|uniref:hypothetical protein n=1 Tax=Chromobacterium vaccinii TaxID=1108595 RepID=UPI0018F887D7|nr:hypothetical protein [Chromobacterium vaccinii]